MRCFPERLGLSAGLLLIATSLSAHHSPSRFDLTRQVTLEGTVTGFEWRNPHVYIQVETHDDDGDDVVWNVEATPPSVMSMSGWSARSLRPGDRVTVTGSPARDPERRMVLGHSVLTEQGLLLNIPQVTRGFSGAGQDPASSFVAGDLSGRWIPQWDLGIAMQFLQPLTRQSLTERGRVAVESFDESTGPATDCISEVVPGAMVFPLVHNIELGEEVTLIRSEGYYIERTVLMDVDTHEGAPYTRQGHSIGHWEGDVLVVDTANFADHRSGNGSGVPSGAQKHLVERFELSADRTQLSYTFWVEDPEYLDEPVTATLDMRYRPDLPAMTPIPCDPEIARRFLED